MSVRTADQSRVSDIKYYAYGVYTVVFSTNDTFTADDFVDTEDLKFAAVVQNSDGVELDNSVSDNSIQVIDTCADAECTVFVFGVKA